MTITERGTTIIVVGVGRVPYDDLDHKIKSAVDHVSPQPSRSGRRWQLNRLRDMKINEISRLVVSVDFDIIHIHAFIDIRQVINIAE